ncbi:DUF5753 domain-containing protein [Micromonospora sp. RHAY321]|nr:DUF5753 domain-containing protein [Micromonospora sp. RHAY321]
MPVRTWSALHHLYVPGLLQTPDYARRILTEMVELHNLDIADVDAAVSTRMQRQHLLYDAGKRFEFLLAEPVLRWLLASPDVMAGQLDRLQTVVGVTSGRHRTDVSDAARAMSRARWEARRPTDRSRRRSASVSCMSWT